MSTFATSLKSGASTIVSSAPGGYLLAWVAGIPVEKWAAGAALLWSLGLMWQHWLWRPWLKGVWQRLRNKRHGRRRR